MAEYMTMATQTDRSTALLARAALLLLLIFALDGCVTAADSNGIEGPLAQSLREASLAAGVPTELAFALALTDEDGLREPVASTPDEGQAAPRFYGLFALDDAQLALAARETGTPVEALRADETLATRASLAWLAAAGRRAGATREPSSWRTALAAFSGFADPTLRSVYAAEVLDTLRRGRTFTARGGEVLRLAPHPDVADDGAVGRSGQPILIDDTLRLESDPVTTRPWVCTSTPSGDRPTPDYARAEWTCGIVCRDDAFRCPSKCHAQEGRVVDRVVLHSTESGLRWSLYVLLNRCGISTHYLVTRAGRVLQLLRESLVAHHAGNLCWNNRSIGIEQVGNAADAANWTPTIYTATADLIADLRTRWSIPLDRDHIAMHAEVPDPFRGDLCDRTRCESTYSACPRCRASYAMCVADGSGFGGAEDHEDPGPHYDMCAVMERLGASCSAVPCRPRSCVAQGRACGGAQDGCGTLMWCGDCSDGESCSADGQCACAPRCAGRACGPDGCGGTCGPGCPAGQTCEVASGSCRATGCSGSATQICGNCGMQSRICTGGRWGAWGPCMAEGVCRPSATQTCGAGGTQTCLPSCRWGSCSGQACVGAVTQGCGRCGTQSRTCNDGTWSAWSACRDEGACAPGSRQACGSGGMQSCGADCRWSACGGQTCAGPDMQPCGRCGTQRRTCTSGIWSAWSACSGEGVCTPGATQACGTGGTQTCTSACGWGPCIGEVVCGDRICTPGRESCPSACGADCCSRWEGFDQRRECAMLTRSGSGSFSGDSISLALASPGVDSFRVCASGGSLVLTQTTATAPIANYAATAYMRWTGLPPGAALTFHLSFACQTAGHVVAVTGSSGGEQVVDCAGGLTPQSIRLSGTVAGDGTWSMTLGLGRVSDTVTVDYMAISTP